MTESKTISKDRVSMLDKFRGKPQDFKDVSFEELYKELQNAEELGDASELGDGFKVLNSDDKGQIENRPFIVVDYKLDNVGKFSAFATMKIVTADNRRLIVNDGGTGIPSQLQEIKASGHTGAILCRKGLKVSRYDVTDEKGEPVIDPQTQKPIQGETWYLDTSV